MNTNLSGLICARSAKGRLSLLISMAILALATVTVRSAPVLGTNGVYTITNPAPTVTLAWNKSTATDVTSYNLYFGDHSGQYTNVTVGVLGTNITVKVPARAVPFFYAVTAVDNVGLESTFSNEVTYTATNTIPPPPVPLPPVTVVAQQKIGNGPWADLEYALSIDPATAPQSMFRLRIAASSSPPPASPTAAELQDATPLTAPPVPR